MTPDSFTNQELYVEVGEGHELYVQDWGNKDAKLTIFNVHGGPGGGCRDRHKQQYDPARQRVIFFDQRGSGRSLPYGSLEDNNTHKLVKDITAIADKLGIKQFALRGGSWGSCLSLAYTIENPERVKAIVIDGIFTGSQSESDWLTTGLFRTFYPEVWQSLLDRTPKSHQNDPAAYHIKRALSDDPIASKESCYAIGLMEGALIQIDDRFTPDNFEEFDPASSKIEIKYLSELCFMPDEYILNNAHKIKAPVYIVQGRYDMVCPPTTAYRLHNELPNSELIWSSSGHRAERETWNVVRTILIELSK